MTIAIPYQANKKGPYGDAKWQEQGLIYLLRSLEKHMGSPDVVILGISKPDFLSDKVTHVHLDRFYPTPARKVYKANEFENFWDTMNKLRWALNNLSEFLWVYDDVVMLREASRQELIQPWYLYPFVDKAEENIKNAKSRWGLTIKQSYEFMQPIYPVYNFEHHFPIYYGNHPTYKETIERLMAYPIPAFSVLNIFFCLIHKWIQIPRLNEFLSAGFS